MHACGVIYGANTVIHACKFDFDRLRPSAVTAKLNKINKIKIIIIIWDKKKKKKKKKRSMATGCLWNAVAVNIQFFI